MQNPRQGSKWHCGKCHTWCAVEAPKCSWCGGPKPKPPPPPPAKPKENDEK